MQGISLNPYQIVTSKGQISDLLYKVIIFLAVFDGIRHNSIFYSFSFLKESFVLILLCMALYESKFRVSNPLKYLDLSFFSLYLFTIGTLVSIGNLNLLTDELFREPPINPLSLHIKTINFFLLIYLFSLYQRLTGNDYKNLINFYLNLTILYIIFSVTSYFIQFPFINEFRPYIGRFSSGYPTADSQSISLALLLLLFTGTKGISYFKAKFLILSVGVLMQATTTGVATYLAIITYIMFFGKWFLEERGYSNFYQSLILLMLLVIVGISFLVSFLDPEIVDAFTMMISAKSEFIWYFIKLKVFGIESETSHHFVTATYHVRQEEIGDVMSVHNQPLDMIFGRGTALGSIVENQFGFTLRAYGYIGIVLYLIFMLGSVLRSYMKGKRHFFTMSITILVLLLTNFSQITSYLFQIACAFALVYNCCLMNPNRQSIAL